MFLSPAPIRIYRSIDNGANWAVLTTSLLNSNVAAFAMSRLLYLAAVFPNDDIYSSSDKGSHGCLACGIARCGIPTEEAYTNGSKIAVLCDSNVYLSTKAEAHGQISFFPHIPMH